MKKFACLFFLLYSTYSISAPASAAYTQSLVSCMVKNATQIEKFTILQAGFSEAVTTIKKPAGSSNIDSIHEEKMMAAFFEILSKCPRELMNVEKHVPNGSEDAGEAFMSVIMLELINNRAVQEAFEKS